jgi:hypothetical protein
MDPTPGFVGLMLWIVKLVNRSPWQDSRSGFICTCYRTSAWRRCTFLTASLSPICTTNRILQMPFLWFCIPISFRSSGQGFWLQNQRSGFDSRSYQIFWEAVGLERGPLSLVSTIEELLQRRSSGSGIEIRDYGRRGSAALTTRHPSIGKSWH